MNGIVTRAAGAILAVACAAFPARAQNAPALPVLATCGSADYVARNLGYMTLLPGGALCISGSLSLAGTTSNAASAVATSATNLPTVAYGYAFNGVSWDQLQVDGSKNLKVDIAAGGLTGTASNASSAVANSSTNTPTVSYNYGYNGTTWDQLQVDGSKNLKITAPNLEQAQGSTTSGQTGPLIQGAVTTGSPTYTTGQSDPLSLDTTGRLRVSAVAQLQTTGSAGQFTPVASAAAESSHVLKASSGNLYGVYATNLTATPGFLVVLNATSAPGDGAITPLQCAPLPANGNASLTWPSVPDNFTTGITAVVTSAASCFTKTTGVITAFFHGDVQ